MRRFLADAGLNFSAALTVRVLEALVLFVASRQLELSRVGLFFLAEGLAGILFQCADFGLAPVITRRAARGQLGRQDFLRALRLRSSAVLLGLALLVPLGPVFLGFAASSALFRTHELARAVLVGQERFLLNASLGVGCRLLGTLLAVLGLCGGGEVWAWIVGRIVAEGCQFLVTFRLARLSLPPLLPDPALRSEGLAFWGRYTLEALANHGDVVLGAALFGPVVATFFGVANRLVTTALLLVGNLGAVLFPQLARNRSFAYRQYLRPVAWLAAGTTLVLAALGPALVGWFLDTDLHDADRAIRTLSLGVFFLSFYQPLVVWLEAHDREHRILQVHLLALPGSLLLLCLLVPHFGIEGAAWAFVGRTALQGLGTWRACRS